MTQWLRQTTAGTVMFGPFVDATDGNTAETGITIAGTQVFIAKGDGTFLAVSGTANLSHVRSGWYALPLGTADTSTLGRVTLMCAHGSALPVFDSYMVVPAGVWDAYFAAGTLTTLPAGGTVTAVTNAVTVSGGTVTAGTVSDKTGYALTTDYPLKTDLSDVADVWTQTTRTITGGTVTVSSGTITAAGTAVQAEFADTLLDRDMSVGADSGGRTPRNAFRALRNKVDAAGTVYKEDDATAAWTFTTTTSGAADPITVIDPA